MSEAKVNQPDDPLADAEVLVVAPRFPSINQPWMDTYLEQLQRTGIRFCVASALRPLGPYQDKVDRLGLRDRVLNIYLDWPAALRSLAGAMLGRPGATLSWRRHAWRHFPAEETFRNRIALAVRGLHVHETTQRLVNLRVVHCHSLAYGYHFMPMARARGLPLVVTFHGLEPPGVPQVAAHRCRQLFAAAARVLVNTEFARRHVIERGCPVDKIEILPQGLPLEDFPFVARPPPAEGDVVELLSVGRFHRDKGQRYCLLALRRLREDGVAIRWHFVGVGPDRPRLRELAQRLDVGDAVEFHEGLSPVQLQELYQRCHLFVLASLDSRGRAEHVETQGVVLQEAQASGCIPIATHVGGIPECINDGRDGLLIRDRSHRAIADAIRQLLAVAETWPKLQAAGRMNVEQRFSADVAGERMAEILRTRMAAGPHA